MDKKGKAIPKTKVVDFSKKYSKHLKGLSSSKSPDLEILLNDEILLKVHKIILASGNDVFKAMLDSQMVESKNNQIEVTNCDPTAFKVFLGHLYTSKVPPKSINLDLLMVANKYRDYSLKKQCFEKLTDEISIDNIVETVKIATQCNFEELIIACQKFVTKNFKKFIGTPQLQAIVENKTFIIEVLKEYDELLNSTKIHKFYLSGLEILCPIEKCERCERPVTVCDCKFSRYRDPGDYFSNVMRPEVPKINFEADNIGWSMYLSTLDDDNDDDTIGVVLTASKKVCADVQLTVMSDDLEFSKITFEKKNETFEDLVFEVFDRKQYDDEDLEYVDGFNVELSIKVLNVEDEK